MTAPEECNAGASVNRRLEAVEAMSLEALRLEWRRLIKTKPSVRLSADLLRRAIAYRLQEAAFGGLRADAAKKLAAIATNSARRPASIKPGTTFIREWHGRTHTVRALDDGFEYQGRRYGSLTTIAREITGAAWSGPRFFGLVRATTARRGTAASVDA